MKKIICKNCGEVDKYWAQGSNGRMLFDVNNKPLVETSDIYVSPGEKKRCLLCNCVVKIEDDGKNNEHAEINHGEDYSLMHDIGITGIDTSVGKFELLPEGTIRWFKYGIGTQRATLTPREWECFAAIIPVMLSILVGEPEEGGHE